MIMNRQTEFLYKLYRVVHSFKCRALIKCNLFSQDFDCASVYTHISQTNSVSVSLSVEIHCRTNTDINAAGDNDAVQHSAFTIIVLWYR